MPLSNYKSAWEWPTIVNRNINVLVVGAEVVRGWETDAAIVVIHKIGVSNEANSVMRAVAHVITLTEV